MAVCRLQFEGVFSAPVQGQQLQLKQTSDATSELRLCCRASVCHSGKGTLDVASGAPRDEGRSCRCRPSILYRNRGVGSSISIYVGANGNVEIWAGHPNTKISLMGPGIVRDIAQDLPGYSAAQRHSRKGEKVYSLKRKKAFFFIVRHVGHSVKKLPEHCVLTLSEGQGCPSKSPEPQHLTSSLLISVPKSTQPSTVQNTGNGRLKCQFSSASFVKNSGILGQKPVCKFYVDRLKLANNLAETLAEIG